MDHCGCHGNLVTTAMRYVADANDITSVVKVCMENTSRRRVFSVNFD